MDNLSQDFKKQNFSKNIMNNNNKTGLISNKCLNGEQRVFSIKNSSDLAKSTQMSLSFPGCGFLSFYYLGVTSCFRQYSIVNDKTIICGASSGVMAGLSLILNMSIEDSTEQLLEVAIKVGSRPLGLVHPNVDLNKLIYDRLNKILTEDSHKKVSGRLFISVTRVSDGRNVLISQFDSKEDLIRAIQCSCFMPFLSGLIPPKYKGIAYIDGALSNNLPRIDDNTLIVCPWSGEFDICPLNDTSLPLEVMFYDKLITVSPLNIYRFTQIAFPPHWNIQSQLCQQGFDDTLRFLQRNNKIGCKRCLSTDISLNPIKDKGLEGNKQSGDSKKDLVLVIDRQYSYNLKSDCKDCEVRRRISTVDSIPDTVVEAIRETYNQLNKGLVKRFCRQLPIKLLSTLFIPFVLLFELIIAMIYGIFLNDWTPGVFKDILNVSNIMIANGLFGRSYKTNT